MRQVIFSGSIVGADALPGFEFNPGYFYSGCCICGDVYQEEADRNPPDSSDIEFPVWLTDQRNRHMTWRDRENKRHPEREHRMLVLSGNFCTPEAALKLAPLGIFSLTDLVMSNEVSSALGEAPRAPVDNPQGLSK